MLEAGNCCRIKKAIRTKGLGVPRLGQNKKFGIK